MSDIEGIKKAVGVGFRKHISEYDSEIIAIPYGHPGSREEVVYKTEEFTSVCPVSGLPDFYTLEIRYVPNELLPELKSLKFYLMSYRDVGILHEDIPWKIIGDLVDKISPKKMRIKLTTAVRGGIATDVVAKYEE